VSSPCASSACPSSGASAALAASVAHPSPHLVRTVANFCNSIATDPLEKAGSEAKVALARGSAPAMASAQRDLFRAARSAPPGAACAANVLNFVASAWQSGASRLHGVDVAAHVDAIRAFQRRRGLERPLPGF